MKKVLIVSMLLLGLTACGNNKSDIEQFQEKSLNEQLITVKMNDTQIKNTPKETFEKDIIKKLGKRDYYNTIMNENRFIEVGVKAKESDKHYTLYFRPAGIKYGELTKDPVQLNNYMLVSIRSQDEPDKVIGTFATDTQNHYLYKGNDINNPMNSLDLAEIKSTISEVSDVTIEREMGKQLETIIREQNKVLDN